MSQHDTLTLREALRSIQYEAASLADAQVIALQALNATYPARAALSATQPAQAAQGEPFGFVHHYVAHDSQGSIIDSTWEADGCEDEMPHPTHPTKWRWERSEPFYTKTAVVQGEPAGADVLDELKPLNGLSKSAALEWLENLKTSQ